MMDSKNNALIKEYIFTALTVLMEQKDFHDITITEITQKAGVSRMSYYRNYASKEDILIQYFDGMAQQLTRKIKEQPEITPFQLCCKFFEFFQNHSILVDNMIKANLTKLMLEHFIGYIDYLHHSILNGKDDRLTEYQIPYHTGGLFTLLIRWLTSGQKESPEEMASIALSMLELPSVSL